MTVPASGPLAGPASGPLAGPATGTEPIITPRASVPGTTPAPSPVRVAGNPDPIARVTLRFLAAIVVPVMRLATRPVEVMADEAAAEGLFSDDPGMASPALA